MTSGSLFFTIAFIFGLISSIATQSQLIADGSFESYCSQIDNPLWTITNSGTSSLQIGSSSPSAYAGSCDVIFPISSSSTISQSFVLPSGGTAILRYWAITPGAPSGLAALMDGTTIIAATPSAYVNWTPFEKDLSSYCDGSSHTLKFYGVGSSGQVLLDNITVIWIQSGGTSGSSTTNHVTSQGSTTFESTSSPLTSSSITSSQVLISSSSITSSIVASSSSVTTSDANVSPSIASPSFTTQINALTSGIQASSSSITSSHITSGNDITSDNQISSVTSQGSTSSSFSSTSSVLSSSDLTTSDMINGICASFIAGGHDGYYCSPDNAGFYSCSISQNSYTKCASGTSCQCASGIECGQVGTESPCASETLLFSDKSSPSSSSSSSSSSSLKAVIGISVSVGLILISMAVLIIIILIRRSREAKSEF